MRRLAVFSALFLLVACGETATQPALDVDPQFAVGGDMDMIRADWKGIFLTDGVTSLELSVTAVGSLGTGHGVIGYTLQHNGKHRTIKVSGVSVVIRPDGRASAEVRGEGVLLVYEEDLRSPDPNRWSAWVAINDLGVAFYGPDAMRLHDGVQVLRDGLVQGPGGGF